MAMGFTSGRGNGPANNDNNTPSIFRVSDAVPPHNIELEEALLGAILFEPELLDRPEFKKLAVEDFFRHNHRMIFAAMRHLHDRGIKIELISLGDELERRGELDEVDGPVGLAELMEKVPHTANAAYHADLLRRLAGARAVIERSQQNIRDAYSNNYTLEELLGRASERIETIDGYDYEEPPEISIRPWPDAPDPAIWHGLVGDIVRLIEPHTEADPMAILGQFLVCFGNIVGRMPYWQVEATRHHCNLFLAIVGSTAKARKGTSWDLVIWLIDSCAKIVAESRDTNFDVSALSADWSKEQVKKSGLSSGEGLIHAIRDPTVQRQLVKQPLLGGARYEDVEIDPGVEDKRALFVENEFGGMLSKASRDGNSLSQVLRNAWDGIGLRSDTKNNPVRCLKPHVSLIGHVTYRELSKKLTDNDISNGFANRIIWLCVKRSKFLSRGGQITKVDFAPIYHRLAAAIEFATFGEHCLTFDKEGGEFWDQLYPELTADKPGVFGDVTSRSDPQTLRLAMIYALLDCSPQIKIEHLKAAVAFWRYSEQSVRFIFGHELSDPFSERIIAALRSRGDDGMSTNEIARDLFAGHQRRKVGETLSNLFHGGVIEVKKVETKGRPKDVWILIKREEPAR